MDESLSEFQEKKQSSSGPKKATKPTSKPKPKKIKRIRGQKDIRTAIKPKKNELITYANDFDKVCKQSGIDVDPEQLQLAIALSKSVQKQENCDSQSSSLSSQERTGKIRTTLLEYGFKVPEIKINPSRKKRLRNKNSKLLLTTEAEKQQIISDKYAQVLFQQLDSSKVLNYNNTNDISAIKLYHRATQESYAVLKSNTSYYIDNLIQQSENTVGSLLRDWSQIPGRPASPVIEACDINFIEIDCSEDELVTVLSGSIESTQELVKIKYRLLKENAVHSPKIILENIANNSTIDTKMNINHFGSAVKETNPVTDEADGSKTVKCNNDVIEIIDIDDVPKLKSSAQVRSCSPDIFDDEVSYIMDHSIGDTSKISLEIPSICRTVINNDVMDLTEGVNVVSQKVITLSNVTNELPNSQLSQGSNITKRKSNDFMEITNCVAGSSQPLIVNNVENIDLTQNSDDREITIAEHETESEEKIVENMDLTQSSNTDDDLPFVQVGGKKCDSLDDTIILNEYAYNGVNSMTKSIKKEQDNSLDTIDFIDSVLREKEPKQEISIDRPVVVSPETNEITEAISNPITIESEEDSNNSPEPTAIHTSSKESTLKKSKSLANSQEFDIKSKTESFFEEFVYDHSDNESKELTEDIVIISLEDNNSKAESDKECNDDDIDLTQSTDSERTVDITNKTRSPEVSYGSLGKKDDVSIDYDEIFDEVIETSASTSKQSDFSSKSLVCEIAKSKSNSELISNCSQNSEVFEIVDQEFEYSVNQSKHDIPVDNFDFGGISIMDDISNIRRSKSTNIDKDLANNDLGKSMSDSLPIVYIKGTKHDSKHADIKSTAQPSITTPHKTNTKLNIITVQTPTNSEYIIKTDQVTPFIDYASMSTPERNKELDRFGLKPFKRKQAVQILTHLYNQTHPTIESCSAEDLPSPSKKQKTNNCHQNITPKKISSSKSLMVNSPKKKEERLNTEDIEKENNVYEITNETPDIRDIECCADDWVFQKREKTKLHSCRVPLHVAFHNYVGARLRLREAILRYEPVNIDVIHKGLVASGYRYDPKDLLKFMDKKCITVKTTDNSSKNNKKHY